MRLFDTQNEETEDSEEIKGPRCDREEVQQRCKNERAGQRGSKI